MRKLTMRQAIDLYLILSPYIPSEGMPSDLLEFLSSFFDKIYDEKTYNVYVNAVELLTGEDFNVLAGKMSPVEMLKLFSEGLVLNKVHYLVRFFRRLGL